MQFRKPGWIIGASALAIVLLLLFQVNWLRQSQQLVEEQFDQKVTMALCSAIDELGSQFQSDKINFDFFKPLNQCSSPSFRSDLGSAELKDMLESTLRRYEIDLRFEFDVIPEAAENKSNAMYCSSMQPLTQDDHTLRVQFLGKRAYVVQELGFMAGSSIILLLFVCGLFVLTLLRYMQHQRLHAVAVDIFNNMAHEFRTPITNISLALNRLKKQDGAEKMDRYVQVIQAENQRLQKQIECILHVAKLDRGDYEFKWEHLELQDILEEVLQDMHFRIEEKHTQVEVHLDPTVSYSVFGDFHHLSNVIRNLIDNALKFSPDHAIISIDLTTDSGQTLLKFQDNGIGMNAQQAYKAFDPFGQTSGKSNGFGLGLYYVKQIIEKHRGQIRLESKPGKGSTFFICLPQKAHANA